MPRRPFFEDLAFPLDEVQRPWLRRGAVVILTPFVALASAAYGIWHGVTALWEECW